MSNLQINLSKIEKLWEEYFSTEDKLKEEMIVSEISRVDDEWLENYGEEFLKKYISKDEYTDPPQADHSVMVPPKESHYIEKEIRLFENINEYFLPDELFEKVTKKYFLEEDYNSYTLAKFIFEKFEIKLVYFLEKDLFYGVKWLYEVEGEEWDGEMERQAIFKLSLYSPEISEYFKEKIGSEGETRLELWRKNIFPGVDFKPAK
jgi:hypothetical protein